MRVTPDIIRQEFIGTHAKVSRSLNPSCEGLTGKTVDETRNTLTILSGNRKRIITKDSAFFCFRFADGTMVEVDGRLIMGRPEDRLKKSIRRLW